MNTLKLTLDNIHETAAAFLKIHINKKIFAFYGSMGAGKTTFIKALCKQLQVTDNVASPTFAIVHEYSASTGKPVYHFDFYRIEEEAELLDIGFYDYISTGNYCFIEWPEKGENLLPDETLMVRIEKTADETRIISW